MNLALFALLALDPLTPEEVLRSVNQHFPLLAAVLEALCLLLHRCSEVACIFGHRKRQFAVHCRLECSVQLHLLLVPGSAIAHASLGVVDAPQLA